MGRRLDPSEQQGRLLESLLTLARSEGGLDHRSPLDLAEIAERMVRTAEGTVPRVGGDNPRAGEGDGPGADGNSPWAWGSRENLRGRLPAPPIGDRDRARPHGGRAGTGRTTHRQPAGQRRALPGPRRALQRARRQGGDLHPGRGRQGHRLPREHGAGVPARAGPPPLRPLPATRPHPRRRPPPPRTVHRPRHRPRPRRHAHRERAVSRGIHFPLIPCAVPR
jgi:hypothetical protein